MAELSRKPRKPETDPNSKTTISSILLTETCSKKKKLTSATFRGLGCTAASSQVSVPAIIRTSAIWESKKLKKKRLIKTKKSPSSLSLALSSSCVSVPDVDCVVSTRPKIDGIFPGSTPRENVEDNPYLEESDTRYRSGVVSGPRHNRHAFREGLAEIVMLQSSLLRGGRSDRYRDLRLDIDNMSYEELLELGDRIGYVNTGLGEDEIKMCLRMTKLPLLDDLSLCFTSDVERKCSICQEEYERDDETGKLNCGHLYHLYCIKQWLGQKNACPICKKSAISVVAVS